MRAERPSLAVPVQFLSHPIGSSLPPERHADLTHYLQLAHGRFRKIDEVRVFTCRAWRADGRRFRAIAHGWNDAAVPGETPLGVLRELDDAEIAEVEAAVRAELERGDAVQLFWFDASANLWHHEGLAPA